MDTKITAGELDDLAARCRIFSTTAPKNLRPAKSVKVLAGLFDDLAEMLESLSIVMDDKELIDVSWTAWDITEALRANRTRQRG